MPIKHPIASWIAVCAIALMACVLADGQTVEKIAPSSGKALCSALTPADFTKAGVQVSALRQANVDGMNGAYCVYDSKAGSVEFDIFFPAGANPAEVAATEKTVLAEIGVPSQPVPLPGAGAAHIAVDAGKSASIVVRKGSAVFDINIPTGPNARQQLIALSQIVLGRLKL
ncbi:MAG TPA: hypothetical protein VKL40_11595 [Candidatus Angelobacter sp.]|nr:hypothetical protein [Candidatus Angelobacter sp.]